MTNTKRTLTRLSNDLAYYASFCNNDFDKKNASNWIATLNLGIGFYEAGLKDRGKRMMEAAIKELKTHPLNEQAYETLETLERNVAKLSTES